MRSFWKKPLAATILAITALAMSPAAMAELMDFTITYTPVQDAAHPEFGSAVLKMTLDTDNIATQRYGGTNLNVLPYVSNFSLTVTNANYGDGSYGLPDYTALLFFTPGQLDYSRQLIGQNGFSPSVNEQFGAFDLIANNNNSPSFYTPMTILTAGNPSNDKLNELMVVTSITAVQTVPEPATYAMLLGGLGLTGFAARRRNGKA